MDMIPLDRPDLAGNFAVWLASTEAGFLPGRLVYATWDVDELKSESSGDRGQGPAEDLLTGRCCRTAYLKFIQSENVVLA